MIEHIQVIPDKCRACRRCEVACIAAHHGMTFKEAMKHRDVLVSRVQVVKAEGFKTTVRCHQCNPAPCCNICPTGALHVDLETGARVIDQDVCIGCQSCLNACIYAQGGQGVSRIKYNPETNTCFKCDLCGGEEPACVKGCPNRALVWVEAGGAAK